MAGAYCGDVCCVNFYKKDGECVECEAGRIGKNCENDCPNGFFGKMCTKECSCTEKVCNPVNGACGINSSGLRTIKDDGGTSTTSVFSHPYFAVIVVSFIVCVTVIVIVAMILYRKKMANYRVYRRSKSILTVKAKRNEKRRQMNSYPSLADDSNLYESVRESKMCSNATLERAQKLKKNKNTRGSRFSFFRAFKRESGTAKCDKPRALTGLDGYHFMETFPTPERDSYI